MIVYKYKPKIEIGYEEQKKELLAFSMQLEMLPKRLESEY